MTRRTFPFFFVLLLAVAPLFGQTLPFQVPARATVVKINGEAFVLSGDQSLRIPLQAGAMVQQGQVLVTEKDSSLLLLLPTGATVQMAESTTLAIEGFTQSSFRQNVKVGEMKTEPSISTTRLNLSRGAIISDVKKLNKEGGSSFTVKTPVGAAGIRGTGFQLAFVPKGDKADFALIMAEGQIEFTFNLNGRGFMVDKGRQLVVHGIKFDSITGKILGLPDDIKVEQAALEQLSRLMDSLDKIFGLVKDITIAGEEGQPGMVDRNSLEGIERASPDADLPTLPLSGVAPGADPGPVRTSPLSGS